MFFHITLVIIAATCALILGLNILIKNPKGGINILFFLQCFILFIGYFVVITAQYSENETDALFGFKLYIYLLLLMCPVALNFYVVLTKININILYKIICYVPAFIMLTIISLIENPAHNVIKIGEIWKVVYSGKAVTNIFFFITLFAYLLIIFIFLIIWKKNTKLNKERKQAAIIIYSVIIILVSIGLIDFIIPLLNLKKFPQTSTFFASIIYTACLFYSLRKYYFLKFDINDQFEDILSHLKEMIIITDNEGKILKTNLCLQESLICCEDEIIRKEFTSIILSDKGFLKNYNLLLEDKIDSFKANLFYKGKNENLLTETHLFRYIDKFGDCVGLIIISAKIRGVKQFKDYFRVTNREFEIIELIVTGLTYKDISYKLSISERTVERHLTNIYSKLEIKNKIELFKIASDFNIKFTQDLT